MMEKSRTDRETGTRGEIVWEWDWGCGVLVTSREFRW